MSGGPSLLSAFPRPIVCTVFCKEGNPVGCPIDFLPVTPTILPVRAPASLPLGGESPSRKDLDEEHHLWCWGCCFGRSGQVPPCAIKRQIKGFSLAHLGNHKLLQSTACQLITRSREVLAAGRWGSLVFVFLLSLSGIAWSDCYGRNAFDVEDTHAVLAKI